MVKRPMVLLSTAALLLLVGCGSASTTTAPITSTGPLVSTSTTTTAPVPTTAATMTTAPMSEAASPMESTGASPMESTGASASTGAAASSTPAPTPAPCAATAGTPNAGASFNPTSITGTADLGHWDSSPAENDALNCALQGFALTYPGVTVTNEDVSGDYASQMVTRFGAHTPPDVFYVNGDTAIDWANQGFLLPLDDYIANTGFDMSHFFPGYQSTFQVNGKTYGIAKDGNTIAMVVNTDLVPNPPKTMDDLIKVATDLKGKDNLQAPMCLSPALDRGLAFLYAQGGSLLSDDGQTEQIDSSASTSAVQWYMNLFKDGLGIAPPSGSWCGEQLGKGNVGIIFEGGWMTAFMQSTYPNINWSYNEMPVGSIGKPMTISYTASYGIGADSANKDQGWTVLQYLTGVDGQTLWTNGGIAIPSRDDVPVPAGFDVISKGAQYAKPGSGFMPHYTDVQTAFANAFGAEITNQTWDASTVTSATATAINTALGH